MKKLSIEEKAKRYDEAIEIINDYYQKTRYSSLSCASNDIEVLEKAFPELKESEGERIRKGLLYVIEHHPTLPTEEAEEYLAWLKKQSEHAKFCDSIQVGDKVTRNEDGVLVNLSQLKRVAKKDEKQGEQKSVPDWMTKFLDELRTKKNYFDWDEHKDIEGGILAIINWMNPTYFNEKEGEQEPIEWSGKIGVKHAEGKLKGMLDRKENSAWSEEDEDILNTIINHFKVDIECTDEDDIVRWLKSLKGRVQPKQEWSKEDDVRLTSTIEVLEFAHSLDSYNQYGKEDIRNNLSWLKSLKLQLKWKPSDEQMEILKELVEDSNQRYFYIILKSLYEQLKNLRDG